LLFAGISLSLIAGFSALLAGDSTQGEVSGPVHTRKC